MGVDIKKRCVIVHRDLQSNHYTSINAIYESDTLSLETAGANFAVASGAPGVLRGVPLSALAFIALSAYDETHQKELAPQTISR